MANCEKNKPYEINNRKNSHTNGKFAKKVAFQEEWGDGHDKRNPNRKARQGKARRQQWLRHL